MNGLRLLAAYQNGNYLVQLFEDGTKLRIAPEDSFIADFPESIDLKITNWCNIGCEFCHENAGTDGIHADLSEVFLDTLHPGTELAIGGGMVTSHPALIPFLEDLRRRQLIPNITLHQKELLANRRLVENLIAKQLVFGIGISMQTECEVCCGFAQTYPNCVIHLINGLANQKIIDFLSDQKLKILILGYKDYRRGTDYLSSRQHIVLKNQQYLKACIGELKDRFSVVGFDNLALKQLEIHNLVDSQEWEERYMGDDGQYTMYIDLVRQIYAKSSTSREVFPIAADIDIMFKHIKTS